MCCGCSVARRSRPRCEPLQATSASPFRARAQQRGQVSGPPPPLSAAAPLPLVLARRLSTAQRRGEPAWHRRQRRARGNARTLLRVAAASRLLDSHHSAQRSPPPVPPAMPDAAPRGKGGKGGGGRGGKGGVGGGRDGGDGPTAAGGRAWNCPLCFLPANYAWRTRCRGCNAHPPRGGNPRGGSTGPAASSQGGGRGQTLAERQLQREKEDEKRQRKTAAERENRELKAELARMRAAGASGKPEPRQLVSTVGEGKGEGDDEDIEMEEGDVAANAFSSWTEEERQERLVVARAGLAYHITRYGEDAEETEEVREEIAGLERASRDAKPFKAHRGLLERKRERLLGKQGRDEKEAERIVTEMGELQSKLDALRSAMAERSKALAQVEEELAELLKKALAEGDAAGTAGQQGDDAASPWSPQSASTILQSLASRPGVPPEFAALLGHVYQAAQAMAAANAATGAAAAPAAAKEGGGPPQQRAKPQQPQQTQVGGSESSGGGGQLLGGPPSQLAPQGRWAKPGAAAAGGAGGTAAQQKQPGVERGGPGPLGATSGTNADGGNGTPAAAAAAAGTEASASSATSTGAAADVGTAAGGNAGGGRLGGDDDDPELLDAEMVDPELDGDVAASIRKLPSADQARLRAALGARGGRRGRATDGDSDETRGNRDRERSPRPTKVGGADDDEV